MTAAVALTIDQARDLLARAPESLPVGYPLVIHSDQIYSDATAGILVIYGLHASLADADAWLGYQAAVGIASSRYTIDPAIEPIAKEDARVVTQVLAGTPQRAYRATDVEAAERAAYEAQQWPDPEAVASKLEAACTVEPGSIHDAEATFVEWYRWAPVKCGDAVALIPWRASRLGNAAVIRRRGGFVLRQVTAVECDAPTFQEWRYTKAGKVGEAAVAPPGGC